jgi:hypothetical protein
LKPVFFWLKFDLDKILIDAGLDLDLDVKKDLDKGMGAGLDVDLDKGSDNLDY